MQSRRTLTAVIGYPISHSLSPLMQNAAFEACGLKDWVYTAFPVAPDTVTGFVDGLRLLPFRGINVTVPHKQAVIPLADWLTERARRAQSVNTLVFEPDGALWGDSTDGAGFLRSLECAGLSLSDQTPVVILGSGGSGRAVLCAARERSAPVTLVSRQADTAQAVLELLDQDGQPAAYGSDALRKSLNDACVLVNCTPVGMGASADSMPPVNVDQLPGDAWVVDLIYRPAQTRLMCEAAERGLRVMNGLSMLVHQGAESFEIWTGCSAPIGVMEAALIRALEGEAR